MLLEPVVDAREPYFPVIKRARCRRRVPTLVPCAAAIAAALVAAGCIPHGRRAPAVERLPGAGGHRPVADFAAAADDYETAAAGGWEEAECEAVAERFVRLSEATAGGLPPALFNAGLAWSHCDRARARELFSRADAAARGSCPRCAGHAPSLLRLGAEAYRRGARDQALAYFERARQADRRSADAYHNLGLLRREAGDHAAAQQDLRRALAVDSDHLGAYTQMALLYLDLGAERPQLLEMAELVCQQAVARARQVGAPPTEVAPIHNTWGLARVARGDVVGAVEQLDRARRLDPTLFAAHMNSGALSLSFRGYHAAAGAFEQALRIRPESYDARVSLGVALRGLERYDEARDAYEAARQLDPRRPEAHYDLAVLLQDYLLAEADGVDAQVGRLGEATRHYESFLETCDESPERCSRPRPEGEAEDVRRTARRRIEACEQTARALREASSPSSS